MPKENKRISVRPLEALEGWFKKKSPHIVQGWQKRFCRIAEKKFFYFKPNDLENPMGVLDFEICAFDFIEIKKNEILTGFMYINDLFIIRLYRISNRNNKELVDR